MANLSITYSTDAATSWPTWVTTNPVVRGNTTVPDSTQVVYDQVWGCWVTSTVMCNAIALTSDTQMWSAWVANTPTVIPYATNQYITTSPYIWQAWTTTGVVLPAVAQPVVRVSYAQPSLTPEEQQAQQARREAREARWAAQEAVRTAQAAEHIAQMQQAQQRATSLLTEHLDGQQREEFAHSSSFFVVSKSGRRYKVTRGWSGNVLEVSEAGREIASYCIHPRESVPVEDNMLAQKLMLESMEDEFLRIANRTEWRRAAG